MPWPAIIGEEVFVMAQRQLQLNRERSPRRMKRPYLLSGLLYCGRRLGGHAGAASGRYDCTRRRPVDPPEQRCHLRSVSQPDIEPVVWEHVAGLLRRPDLNVDYLRQQRELKRLRRQRAALAREEQRLVDAHQVGAVELDELKESRQRLREAGRQADERMGVVEAQVAQARQATRVTETVAAFCERIKGQLVEPPFALKQRILRLVVERIVVTDEEIVIQHIIPGDDSDRLHLRPNGARPPPGGGARVGGRARRRSMIMICWASAYGRPT